MPKANAVDDWVALPSGTRLFHGTDSRKPFEMLTGPAWLAENLDTAELWVGWKEHGGGGSRRIYEYETTRDLKLVNVTKKSQWELLGSTLLDDPEPYIWTLADMVRAVGYDGWWSRDFEVMISKPKSVLRLVKIHLGF